MFVSIFKCRGGVGIREKCDRLLGDEMKLCKNSARMLVNIHHDTPQSFDNQWFDTEHKMHTNTIHPPPVANTEHHLYSTMYMLSSYIVCSNIDFMLMRNVCWKKGEKYTNHKTGKAIQDSSNIIKYFRVVIALHYKDFGAFERSNEPDWLFCSLDLDCLVAYTSRVVTTRDVKVWFPFVE